MGVSSLVLLRIYFFYLGQGLWFQFTKNEFFGGVSLVRRVTRLLIEPCRISLSAPSIKACLGSVSLKVSFKVPDRCYLLVNHPRVLAYYPRL